MPEVQDILIEYPDAYKATHLTTYMQDKAMNAPSRCPTASLGGHATVCEKCGNLQISYNSCRNPHCPKCQTLAKEKWIDNQKYRGLSTHRTWPKVYFFPFQNSSIG